MPRVILIQPPRALISTVVAAASLLALTRGHLAAQGSPIHASVSFSAPVIVTSTQLTVYSIAVADFDLDDHQDVAVVSPGIVAWYRNNGDGTFGWNSQSPNANRHLISDAPSSPTCVFAADIDHDGRVDVAVSSYADYTISWFRNVGGTLGSGLFDYDPGNPEANFRTVSTSAGGATSVAVSDVDGDGLRDILSTSAYDRKVAWYRNLGGGNFGWIPAAPAANQNIISTAGQGPQSVTVADLDGDSIRDLVVASATDNTIAWFKGSFAGAGVPQYTRYVIASNQPRASTAAIADLDRDGWPDVICGAPYGNLVTWFRNQTHDSGSIAPFFGTGQAISANAQGVSAAAASDLDSDSRPDALAASYFGDKATWYQNLGAGDFGWNPGIPTQNEKPIATNALGARAIATADFNQDGTIDVVYGSEDDGKVAICLNLGGQCAFASFNSAPVAMLAGSRDDLLRITVSNRGLAGDNDANLSSLSLLIEKNPGVPMTTAEVNPLIESLSVFVDSNNSGNLEFNADAIVGTIDDLQLIAGRLTLTLQPANLADTAIPAGTTRNYFVVARLAANAATQSPSTFRITHLSQGSGHSVVTDALSGAVLTVETATNPDTPSSLVTAQQPHTYANWSVIHFDTIGAPGTGPGESQFTGDISNLLKYALAANPLANNGPVALPQIHTTGNNRIFRHRKPSWATDVAYHYEISHDLLDWVPAVNGVDYQLTDTPLPDQVIQSDLVFLGNWAQSFMRVRVVLAN